MKLSPTTLHFLQVNRWVCLASAAVLALAVGLSLFFASDQADMRSAADSSTLQRIQLVSLPDVRSTGHVQPIFIRRIDTDLSVLPAPERKSAFLRMILPLVARENDRIRADRRKLIDGKAPKGLFARYLVASGDVEALKRRVDIIPASLVLAQAALESGWGTSRFALEGNNLFGMRTYDEKAQGLAPAGATGFKVMSFDSLGTGVAAYMANLNTHRAYRKLRAARAAMRRTGKLIAGQALTSWLTGYSEIPEKYGALLRELISRERLAPLDNVRIGAEG
jgi:Bax protein